MVGKCPFNSQSGTPFRVDALKKLETRPQNPECNCMERHEMLYEAAMIQEVLPRLSLFVGKLLLISLV